MNLENNQTVATPRALKIDEPTKNGSFRFPLFEKSVPTSAELAERAARSGKRLEECEKLWRRKTRYIDEERPNCTWEELRPQLDAGYQPCVDEVMQTVNSPRGPHVIYYGDTECPDGVLANLLRAWYHLPEEEDVLLFVNDQAKYAYFISNMNPYMTGGEWLGWDEARWSEKLRLLNASRGLSIPASEGDRASFTPEVV